MTLNNYYGKVRLTCYCIALASMRISILKTFSFTYIIKKINSFCMYIVYFYKGFIFNCRCNVFYKTFTLAIELLYLI
jgi:hypothetical protein